MYKYAENVIEIKVVKIPNFKKTKVFTVHAMNPLGGVKV
jgi:hypothetical protein